jgi:HEAT repeat protein
MLDQAFEALKTFDWGTEPQVLKPIEEAVVATADDAAARQQLETRLAEALSSDIPRAAKDYVCRQLMVVGTAASVPALAQLLSDEQLANMARYALTRMPAAEAAEALRAALPQLSGELKVGVISSLGDRGDEASVAALKTLLADNDMAVAHAAALALGAIRSPEAAAALLQAAARREELRSAATDAALACAEALLAAGKKKEALAIYRVLVGGAQPKHVRLAATRGMLACAG